MSELTLQEQTALRLLSETGGTNQDIADAMGLSVKTVKHYMTSIFQKTRSRTRVQAVLWYQAQGQQLGFELEVK